MRKGVVGDLVGRGRREEREKGGLPGSLGLGHCWYKLGKEGQQGKEEERGGD